MYKNQQGGFSVIEAVKRSWIVSNTFMMKYTLEDLRHIVIRKIMSTKKLMEHQM